MRIVPAPVPAAVESTAVPPRAVARTARPLPGGVRKPRAPVPEHQKFMSDAAMDIIHTKIQASNQLFKKIQELLDGAPGISQEDQEKLSKLITDVNGVDLEKFVAGLQQKVYFYYFVRACVTVPAVLLWVLLSVVGVASGVIHIFFGGVVLTEITTKYFRDAPSAFCMCMLAWFVVASIYSFLNWSLVQPLFVLMGILLKIAWSVLVGSGQWIYNMVVGFLEWAWAPIKGMIRSLTGAGAQNDAQSDASDKKPDSCASSFDFCEMSALVQQLGGWANAKTLIGSGLAVLLAFNHSHVILNAAGVQQPILPSHVKLPTMEEQKLRVIRNPLVDEGPKMEFKENTFQQNWKYYQEKEQQKAGWFETCGMWFMNTAGITVAQYVVHYVAAQLMQVPREGFANYLPLAVGAFAGPLAAWNTENADLSVRGAVMAAIGAAAWKMSDLFLRYVLQVDPVQLAVKNAGADTGSNAGAGANPDGSTQADRELRAEKASDRIATMANLKANGQ